jgi:hypothetical protein
MTAAHPLIDRARRALDRAPLALVFLVSATFGCSAYGPESGIDPAEERHEGVEGDVDLTTQSLTGPAFASAINAKIVRIARPAGMPETSTADGSGWMTGPGINSPAQWRWVNLHHHPFQTKPVGVLETQGAPHVNVLVRFAQGRGALGQWQFSGTGRLNVHFAWCAASSKGLRDGTNDYRRIAANNDRRLCAPLNGSDEMCVVSWIDDESTRPAVVTPVGVWCGNKGRTVQTAREQTVAAVERAARPIVESLRRQHGIVPEWVTTAVQAIGVGLGNFMRRTLSFSLALEEPASLAYTQGADVVLVDADYNRAIEIDPTSTDFFNATTATPLLTSVSDDLFALAGPSAPIAGPGGSAFPRVKFDPRRLKVDVGTTVRARGAVRLVQGTASRTTGQLDHPIKVLRYCTSSSTSADCRLDPTWMNQKLASCYSRSVTCSVGGGAPLAVGCGCFAGDAEKGCAMALTNRLGRTPEDITYGTGNGKPWQTVCPGPSRFYSGEWSDSRNAYYLSCSVVSGALQCSQSPLVTPR